MSNDGHSGSDARTSSPTESTFSPVADLSLRERVKEAGVQAEELFKFCWSLLHIAHVTVDHYLKLQHTAELLGPGHLTLVPRWRLWRAMMEDPTNSKSLTVDVDRCRTLLDDFSAPFDAVSARVFQVGPVSASNFHEGAVALADRLYHLWRRHFVELLPTHPDADAGDPHALLAALPQWRENALRFVGRLTAVVGTEFAANFENWIAAVRWENAKALAALPRESTVAQLGPEERILVDALRQAGRNLTQAEICRAARLSHTGTRNSTLANLVARGVLRSSTRGYSLPEWDAR